MADAGIAGKTNPRNQHFITHGLTIGKVTPPEYHAWKGMRYRCTRPFNPRYPLYGGRGIKVCDQWMGSFEQFLADVGPKPTPSHSLDRIDVNGNYEPGNVRWASQKVQCRNQRRNRIVSYQGRELTLAELAEATGIDPSHISYHLSNGRTADEAVSFIVERRLKPDAHCINGHALIGENRYVAPTGKPQCRKCRAAARARSKARKDAA